MKSKKLEDATMKALQCKLEEVYVKEYLSSFTELYSSSWGPAIEVLDKIAENDLEDELMNWLEDLGTEDTPIDRTELNDYIAFQSEDIYDALGLDENGDPLDESKKIETKGSDKTYTCIEDRQGGDFAVGYTMTAEEWGETAYSWAYGDDWSDPEEPLLKNFDTEQECIDFIQDMWELTIVPSDDPQAKEFLGKKQEARSHKEDNERVAPRFITTKNGNKKRARNMVDVTNPKVGNKSYHNEKGNQYWGTTEDEYASKRNKTGQKNDNGTEQYLADYDDMQNPVKKFQYLKGQAKSRSDDAEQLKKIGSRVRAQWKKDYYNQGIKSAQAQADRQNAEATDIVNQERERIANKQKNTESKNTSKLSVKITLDENKTEGLKGNTIPRNWKKITYKSKIDTNLYKAGDTLEVERDEWDRPIVKNTSTGEAGRLNWDIIRNPELAEIINIEKKTEARNPENDEINTKIRKSLNGSTKYKDDLKKAGLEVSQNEKGKVTAINDMDKEDLKNSHPDTDYYNYLTKQKVQPEVTDTGAFSPTNPFRNSDNFENTISKEDRTVYKSDNNGVSRAIPKKYKTGRKNFGYNPDEFPRKSYNGVASYEPLEDKELKDFKYAKSTTSDGGWKKQDLNRAKAEYDRAKAEYDKDANKVNSIRDRIAKSKANRKAETRSHKEDRKITEATTDVNEVVDEYKEAYHKDLDLKTVPCVIARDKMLSGWGGAEGKNHYQVVLCADSTEAHNIANNMQAAKREQLANVRVSFGVKLPSRASVAYCVGRNASAWNMGDNWYERYDTEKKTESKEQTNTNIADTFRNYNAFKNNFGDIIIIKSKYNKEYYFYKTEEDFKNDNYFNHTPSKDYVEGWLYGAVQANNSVVRSIK